MKIFLLFCSVIPIVWTRLAPCPTDQGSLPKKVVISNCDNNEECDFTRGKSILGDFEFVAESDITTLYPVIYMTLGKDRMEKAHTDAPIDRFSGCDWLLDGYTCPITKGKSAVWRLNLPIHKMERLAKGAVEIQMRNQDNGTVFCAIIWGDVYPL